MPLRALQFVSAAEHSKRAGASVHPFPSVLDLHHLGVRILFPIFFSSRQLLDTPHPITKAHMNHFAIRAVGPLGHDVGVAFGGFPLAS